MSSLAKVLFIILWMPTCLFSQFSIDKMGIEAGLSDNYILSIAQDKDGFVWIGTADGLNRFDGHSFESFKVTPSDRNTVSDNGINKILADTVDNVLWIATKHGGLNAFDCSSHQFIHYPIYTDEPNSTHAAGITDLCFDEVGNVWIATYNEGLKKLDKKNNRILHIDLKHPSLPTDYRIKSIADDGKGNLYIGHWGNGFTVLNVSNGSCKRYWYNADNPHGLPGNEILDICIDSRHNIWLATHRGPVLYHQEKETFTTFRHKKGDAGSLSNDDIHSLCEIDGTLWIGTWKGGVNRLDLNTADLSIPERVRFQHIPCNDLPAGLSSPSVVEIFRDFYGNIWLGTYGEGLNVIGHAESFFKTLSYSPIKGNENSLSDKTINCICYDWDDRLWTGTRNGYVDVYQKDNSGDYRKVHSYFFENDVLSCLIDNRGNIWFGVDRKGLFCFDKKEKTFKRVKLTDDDYKHSYIACLYEDEKQNIWVGTNDGILKYNRIADVTEELSVRKIGLSNDLVRNILQDAKGNFWIGSETDGVSLVTPAFDLIGNFNTSTGLPSNTVTHLYKDSDQNMWVTTTKGVAIFPPAEKPGGPSFILNQETGLPDNHVRAVMEGKKGEIWIATNPGISRYSVKEKKTENFDHSEGIPWATFGNGAVTKSPGGIIFFGSQAGVCYFDSGREPEKHILPPVRITHVAVYDSKEDFSDYIINKSGASRLSLTYNLNTIAIDFSVPDYALKDRVEYAYRLKGMDDTWYRTYGRNQVVFRNLPPGNYEFHVKAKSQNGEWTEHITAMGIEIAPPFWLSWWAKAGYLFIIISVIVVIVRFYKRKLNLENRLYLEKQNHLHHRELNEERIRFYTHITHELRTPLTLIVGPLEDLAADKSMKPEQTKKISLIHKSVVRLTDLINRIMEFRKSETHNRTLNVVWGDPSELIYETVLKYKELNRNSHVSIDFFSESEVRVYYDKEVWTILLDNLISNALKYTREGSVTVILRQTEVEREVYTELEIRDTGCGIPEESLEKIFESYYRVTTEDPIHGSGIGLALVKNLVELHRGTIRVESKINRGTSFYVRFRTADTYPEAYHKKKPDSGIKLKKEVLPVLLVVEDNDDIRGYIADSFSDSFDIIEAKDGREGIRLAREKMPDIIISDIMMPLTEGTTLCKTLKEDIRTGHIPIILLTAKDSEESKTEGYSLGADSYITKPFSANMLKTRVVNLLEARRKMSDYFSGGFYKNNQASEALNRLDNEFAEKIISIIKDHMESDRISIPFLSGQFNMSYSAFSKKIKAVTGMTVNEFVRKVKMQYAEQLLLSRKYSISEIAYRTGYNSMSYFREAFKAEFGVLPSKYLSNLSESEK